MRGGTLLRKQTLWKATSSSKSLNTIWNLQNGSCPKKALLHYFRILSWYHLARCNSCQTIVTTSHKPPSLLILQRRNLHLGRIALKMSLDGWKFGIPTHCHFHHDCPWVGEFHVGGSMLYDSSCRIRYCEVSIGSCQDAWILPFWQRICAWDA